MPGVFLSPTESTTPSICNLFFNVRTTDKTFQFTSYGTLISRIATVILTGQSSLLKFVSKLPTRPIYVLVYLLLLTGTFPSSYIFLDLHFLSRLNPWTAVQGHKSCSSHSFLHPINRPLRSSLVLYVSGYSIQVFKLEIEFPLCFPKCVPLHPIIDVKIF